MTNEKENLRMDWQQVVLNGGHPCFHVDHESPNRYCGRAQRWDGHGPDHAFVSLDDLLATVRADEREAAFKDAMKIIDEAGEEWGIQARDRKSKTYSAYALAALDLKGRIEAAATENRKGEG